MPLARYFSFVGGVLLTLMFILDASLPKAPVVERADTPQPVIRIHSERKWPERVVFDTSLPTIAPTQPAKVAASVPAPAAVADVSAIARVRDAFALLQSSDQKQAQISEVKKLEVKSQQRKRQIAKRRTGPPLILVAQQPQLGFFHTW
jgi:hypothetical protein